MKSAFVGRKRSAATALCAVVAAIALSGCGGSDGTSPTPRQAFTGNFAGTVALDSGRYWQGFFKYPGTISLQFLQPIPPGLKRAAFMSELEMRIETATNRLLQT